MTKNITASQLHKEGRAAYFSGDMDHAVKAFEAAAEEYTEAGNPVLSAEMRNNACVAYLQMESESERALRLVEGTPETFAAAGEVRRQALALGNLGAALESLERFDEALEAYQASSDLLKQLGEDNLRVDVAHTISSLQMRSGRQLQALATMKNGLDDLAKPNVRQRFLKRLLNIPFRMMEKG